MKTKLAVGFVLTLTLGLGINALVEAAHQAEVEDLKAWQKEWAAEAAHYHRVTTVVENVRGADPRTGDVTVAGARTTVAVGNTTRRGDTVTVFVDQRTGKVQGEKPKPARPRPVMVNDMGPAPLSMVMSLFLAAVITAILAVVAGCVADILGFTD